MGMINNFKWMEFKFFSNFNQIAVTFTFVCFFCFQLNFMKYFIFTFKKRPLYLLQQYSNTKPFHFEKMKDMEISPKYYPIQYPCGKKVILSISFNWLSLNCIQTSIVNFDQVISFWWVELPSSNQFIFNFKVRPLFWDVNCNF